MHSRAIARHSFNKGIHSSEIVTMRHLSLNIELESPICYAYAITQIYDHMREKVGEKFKSYISVSARLESTVPTSTFKLISMLQELSESYCYDDGQVIKFNTRVTQSKHDILQIDIFEMELSDAYNSGN